MRVGGKQSAWSSGSATERWENYIWSSFGVLSSNNISPSVGYCGHRQYEKQMCRLKWGIQGTEPNFIHGEKVKGDLQVPHDAVTLLRWIERYKKMLAIVWDQFCSGGASAEESSACTVYRTHHICKRKSNSEDARPKPCWRATDERSTCRTPLPPYSTAAAPTLHRYVLDFFSFCFFFTFPFN